MTEAARAQFFPITAIVDPNLYVPETIDTCARSPTVFISVAPSTASIGFPPSVIRPSLVGTKTVAVVPGGMVKPSESFSPSSVHEVAMRPRALRYEVLAQWSFGSIWGSMTICW